jgi:hypothetical protein
VPGTPAPSSKKWLGWVIGGAAAFVVVLVVAVVLVVVAVNGGGGSAKDVAQQYLSDIAKGDATAANRLARIDKSDSEAALLTDSVLAKATRISSPSVTGGTSSSRSGLMNVKYALGGVTYRDSIMLLKDGKGWYVESGLRYGLPMLDSSIAAYRIAGSPKTFSQDDDTDLKAYPGLYTIEAPDQYFTVSGTPKITVAKSVYSAKEPTMVPSAAFLKEVQKQVDAHFDACAAKTDLEDLYDCGIDLGFPQKLDSDTAKVAVTIVAYPAVTAAESRGSGNLFDIEAGQFAGTATGTNYDGTTGTEQLAGKASYLDAEVSIKDGKVVVDFD